ncbi:MAG TPA: PASTA domain-containing protein [bacterium]|nr:PASTA domain-containing protein [bacterium]HPR87287.1 PASTA domain-containing protein [bacterium]
MNVIQRDWQNWESLSWKRKTAYLAAAVVLLYLLFDWAIMPLYTRQYQSIPVPDVLNIPFNAAERRLKDLGLRVVKAEEQYDEKVAAGDVRFQIPEAGIPVKKGRRIYLTISKGHKILTMPKLTGMSERDARFALEEAELLAGEVDYRTDEFYPAGVVCGQSVAAGADIRHGTHVDLSVSVGIEPSEYIVPATVGLSLDQALQTIRQAGLTPGVISEQRTGKLLPNTVVSQSIEAGTVVSKGDSLNLVISILE